MNDITALMGKLKANVAYLQFDEPMTEQRVYWPVLDRAVQAQTTEVVVAEAVEALASVEVAPIRTIGPWSGSAIDLHAAMPAGERAAVLLEAADGRIIGAAQLPNL